LSSGRDLPRSARQSLASTGSLLELHMPGPITSTTSAVSTTAISKSFHIAMVNLGATIAPKAAGGGQSRSARARGGLGARRAEMGKVSRQQVPCPRWLDTVISPARARVRAWTADMPTPRPEINDT